MRRVRGIALHFYASTRPLPHGTNWVARWGRRALLHYTSALLHGYYYTGAREYLGVEGALESVLSRFWGELEGAFRGVFEVLLRFETTFGRKSVFLHSNFPFKNQRKTRGFLVPEKT